MKRLFPLAIVSVLVAPAGQTLALQPAKAAGTQAGCSNPALAGARSRAAGRGAGRLLRRVVLPSGARPVSEQAGSAVLGSTSLGVSILNEWACRHAYWQVSQSAPSAISFVKRHPISGFDWSPRRGRERPGARSLEFGGSRRGGRPSWAALTFSFVPASRATVIRIDAQVAWIYPRSPREVIPTSVSRIGVHSGRRSWLVTNPSKVSLIDRWFDALNVVQPDTGVYGCSPFLPPRVTFVFRSAQGAVLANATAPSRGFASWCDQIKFSVRGHEETPLIDSTPFQGKAFTDRVQRLLGVRFGPRR